MEMDKIFQQKLKEFFLQWTNSKIQTGINVSDWWEIVVKPLIKKLSIERSLELSKEKLGELNLLEIKQSYLVRKIQSGQMKHLHDLYLVQSNIDQWHKIACEKIKLISKCDEVSLNENFIVYHHELHKRHIKKNIHPKVRMTLKN